MFTGSVWVDINYLTLRAIKLHYLEKDERFKDIYFNLRKAVINNVCQLKERDGYFYRNYHDQNGEGLG